MVNEKDASLKQCLVVVGADDLLPNCSDIAVVGVEGGEKCWPELNPSVFQGSRK